MKEVGMPKGGRSGGQDVTTEAYPYGAGMTAIESALFDNWETWTDDRFNSYHVTGSTIRFS